MFFGFTHCPDVCPMTLNKLSIILEKLEKENKSLKVFFISIDPERDTPEVMKDYLNSFEGNSQVLLENLKKYLSFHNRGA